MIITLGLKLTHDATVALFENNRLLFSVELEKLANNRRYMACDTPATIVDVLKSFGIRQVHRIAVDGWKSGAIPGLDVATYHEYDGDHGALLQPRYSTGLDIAPYPSEYVSYKHIAGHVVGSYMTSPFIGRIAYVVTWDGGTPPRLHCVHPNGRIEFLGLLFELYGVMYGIMGHYFGPYARPEIFERESIDAATILSKGWFGGYDKPGKLMSYIALGVVSYPLLAAIRLYYEIAEYDMCALADRLSYKRTGLPEHELCRAARTFAIRHQVNDADVLATIHQFLEELLVERATVRIPPNSNLIFTGGSALNIKWNTALRSTGYFRDVFVPPFPNDTGSALGTAACDLWAHGSRSIDWDVYSGPLLYGTVRGEPCSASEVGRMLAERKDRPIVVLHGRAELGPRSLGHRSILMSPELAANQQYLNNIKRRESFRPIAPVCLEEHAASVFDPGIRDPWMLYDHRVRENWRERIPAIVHLDGTARLQTMHERNCVVTTTILRSYYARTGIPLLCNTSANLPGCGFFPDQSTAIEWNRVADVWADGFLYTTKGT